METIIVAHMQTQTQAATKTSTRTKVVLALLSLSGIALAGALLTQNNTDTSNTGDSAVSGAWTCSETDTVANFQVKGITTALQSGTAQKKVSEDICLPDGKMLFQKSTDGQVAIWRTDGTTFVASDTVGPVPGADRKLIGSKDFTGDQRPDLLVQIATDGQAIVWKLNGTELDGSGIKVGPAPGAGWKLVGADDFTSDGKSDLLWQNTADGQASVWKLNGTDFESGGKIGAAPGAGWKLVGAYDFTSDGKSDLLWQNTADGQASVWKLNGTDFESGGKIGAAPGAGWKLVGAYDFTSDGKPDLLWQNTATGQASVWKLNGTIFESGIKIGAAPGAGWKLVGAYDLTDDGKPDLLWQNTADGQASVWKLNGTDFAGGTKVGSPAGKEWNLIGADNFKSDTKPMIEYYCDSLAANGFSSYRYKCNSCDAGQCASLWCGADADCNDLYLYTFGTCQNNTCELKKIDRYFDLTLKRAAGETEFSLYEGSVKNLEGTENLDEFFSKKDDGYIARYTSSKGEQLENYWFDLMEGYMLAFRFESDNLVEDEYIKLKLPYGEDGYQSIQIQTPGQEKTVVTIEPAKLPLAVAQAEVEADARLAAAPKENSGEERVLGEADQRPIGQVCGKTWPTTEQVIPDDIQFSSSDGRSADEMKEIFKVALRKFGSKMAASLPKHINFVSTDEISKITAGAAGVYKKKGDLMYVDTQGNSIEDIVNRIIPHEAAHATHLGPLNLDQMADIRMGWSVPDPITAEWQKISGDSYTSKYLEELGSTSSWSGSGYSDHYFYNGFVRPYGATELFEDVATYADMIGQDPSRFVNYASDKDSAYYKKLALLKDMGIITQDQFDIFDSCQCLGTDILMYDDYPMDDDIYIQGGDDKCLDGSMLYEVFCKEGIKDAKTIECSGLCDQANGRCNACSEQVGGDPPFISYATKISENQYPHYEEKQRSLAECIDNGTKLDLYGCNNGTFSIPVVKGTEVCDWKCGPNADGVNDCLECNTDCRDDKIGTTRNTATAGTFEKCEDPDGDGCGEWSQYSCSPFDCYGDKIGTTKCGSTNGSSFYEKCEDPDGDKCGTWNTSFCPMGTFCASNQTKCGNWCDATKETDSGINYNKYGSVLNLKGTLYKDVCSSGSLVEYSCANGAVASQNYQCPQDSPCSEGACGYRCDPTKETDGGAIYDKSGRVFKLGSATFFEDKCVNDKTLKETVCNVDGRLEYQTYECRPGSNCFNGACVKSCDPAKETDGGRNYQLKGSVIDYLGKAHTDACTGTMTFTEYYCESGIQSMTVACGSGYYCKDGYCAKVPVPIDGAGGGVDGETDTGATGESVVGYSCTPDYRCEESFALVCRDGRCGYVDHCYDCLSDCTCQHCVDPNRDWGDEFYVCYPYE